MTITTADVLGMLEHFDLADAKQRLSLLTDTDMAWWGKPASLSRFGQTEMNWGQFRRFCKHVELHDMGYTTPCLLWTGGLHDKGYGRFYLGSIDGKPVWAYAHRISFEHWIGFPPKGYIVDHECNVKTCCNPTHLWPQTNKENLRLADERRPWKRRNQYSKE